jgi:hypothetical protein
MLQLAAHHAGTRLHLLEVESVFTQFRERSVGLLFNLGTDECSTTLEGPVRTVDLGVCNNLTRRALSMQPFLDRRQADSESSSYGGLCPVTHFGGNKDPLA